jgi:flagellar hook assembly protein FlgD
MGREVKTLVNEFKDAGYHTVIWDARNDKGNLMGGGVYLYSIDAGTYRKTQKMVLLK